MNTATQFPFKFTSIIFLLGLCLLLSDCKSPESFTTPKVTTIEASAITRQSAIAGGVVTANGGATVIDRGVCWNDQPNATLENNKTMDGGGNGDYVSQLTGLLAGKTYFVRAYATNKTGTGYGNEIEFTTLPAALPSLTTTSIGSLTRTAATSGGNITDDGGAAITQRGVCWNTEPNPTTSNNKSIDATGNAAFSSALSTLTAGAKYYVKAFATNSVGTAYGNEIEFTTLPAALPSLTTTSIGSLTRTAATSGGNITDDGGAAITQRGICWNTEPNPTTSNNKSIDATGNGAFSSALSTLTAGTKYYVRAFATNSVGTAYGNEIEFTSLLAAPPSLTTTSISSITRTAATSGGNITDDGGAAITKRGICWNTEPNPTTLNNKSIDATGNGAFSNALSSLTAGTKYYVKAFATNSVGTAYGNEIEFTSLLAAPPSLTTTSISSITRTAATSGGNITDDGGAAITKRGICWNTEPNPTTLNNKSIDATGNGAFSNALSSLTAGTKYYVKAFATNSVGTGYGNEISFNTLPPDPPKVATATPSAITGTSAISGGTVTSDGGAPISARGVCWSTNLNPTASDTKAVDASGSATFTSTIINLSPGTVYHVRAFATNSAGTTYGEDKTFSTASVLPTIITLDASSVNQTNATVGGTVTNTGGEQLLARGVVWSTTQNPTLANEVLTDALFSTGMFTLSLSGLSASTTYYFKAYATNSVGTVYGDQKQFTTSASLTKTEYFVGYDKAPSHRVRLWKDGVVTDIDNGSGTMALRTGKLVVTPDGSYYAPLADVGVGVGTNVPQYIKDGTVIALPQAGSEIAAVAVEGTAVYAAGYRFGGTNGRTKVATVWANGVQSDITDGTGIANMTAIAVVRGDVHSIGYEAGASTSTHGVVGKIIYVKNGVKSYITTDYLLNGQAFDLFVDGSDVYIAGNVQAVPSLFAGGNKIAKYWKNGVGVELTDGATDATANAITTSNGDVYVAGSMGGRAVYWKNKSVVRLTDGLKKAEGQSIFVSGSDVYVAGYELNASNILVAKYWKNGSPVSLGDGVVNSVLTGVVVR